MNYSIKKIGAVLSAVTQGNDQIKVTGVAFNSRDVKIGDLFVALVADSDGHRYLQDALDRGAAAVLVDDNHAISEKLPAIIVKDTLTALQQLASYYRQQINPKVIAITGSNGKTTTKDMTAAIVSTVFKTFKTPNNFNNEIGVPMTLLSMPEDTEVLVVELGMDRSGQLTMLSQLVQPDIAIITMIGEAHIEFFKTRANIAKAKLEITNGLKADGVLFIPFDEPLLTQAVIMQRVVWFGQNIDAVETASDHTNFIYKNTRFAIPLIGGYNIMNALAAISAGILLHIDLKKAVQALQTFDLTKNRTERLVTARGVILISDVYNSNPTAVAAVLATLKAIPAQHKYVVLGDMLELGEQANELHAGLGQKVLDANVDGVYLVGKLFNQNMAPMLKTQFESSDVHQYTTDQLAKLTLDLQTLGEAGDVILLKASHGIHLENVVNALIE
ncbi:MULTISPECIES: UDP-N-acetylmuramoyl-tripeptide--D-alanyl-D-alanine ligase [Leuconostoc]|uniref:UDP-N-acetylmuramoyl-tripeptide--D-alanyl-D-alanine ligase n=2 Tax=Leuconostoc kimchii TaxID=136609 RepID=D5T2Z6_LEUKI|nr:MULTISPECIES: UDP-N-acetylmuramoyl-tripeptide--D-alanyl-D-alanine ligase [Leuconostoc]ADG40645.1 UDP-N-acetylmuramoylalanyl-D-glutamyl-2,6-diaminopimelate--D-alanyl-D-alanine ligase [Leuconostoc kimchii IMSNU 11154]AEJ31374.1 UDP-N-acetylmuramoylalanyl-D-glutamyl-2, 6-diaminopimelate--D-alanyl-D-alanine ligase [Leuconostoc sp. C2]QBR47102.1 UDP-N-acetylmuramoyl-tripeptide--D-alanyl-D-alanine ligase [Leuconostoc kimchii]